MKYNFYHYKEMKSFFRGIEVQDEFERRERLLRLLSHRNSVSLQYNKRNRHSILNIKQ